MIEARELRGTQMDEKREVLGDPKRGLRTFICCFAMLGLWMRISRNSEPPTSLAS